MILYDKVGLCIRLFMILAFYGNKKLLLNIKNVIEK